MQEIRKYHKQSENKVLILGIVIGIFALIICGLGIWLVYLNSQGKTSFNIIGQKFESDNMGISSIFIGAVVLIYTISKIFKSLQKSSDNYSSNIGKLFENRSNNHDNIPE